MMYKRGSSVKYGMNKFKKVTRSICDKAVEKGKTGKGFWEVENKSTKEV